MSLYRSKKSPYWQFDFVVRATRFHGSTGTKNRRSAEAIEARLRTEAAESGTLRKRPHITLDQAALRYYEEDGKFKASAKTIEYQLARLCDGLGKDTLLADLNGERIITYIAKRRAKLSNSSVNRELELLRVVMRRADLLWKVDVGEMPEWRRLKLPAPTERIRELSADEEVRLFDELRTDFHPLVRFCLMTGIRLGNAITLTWGQVDLDAGLIWLKVKSTKPGGENHTVPLTPQIRGLLAVERDRHPERVFTYECAGSRQARKKGLRYPFTLTGWRRAWWQALADAGIKDFRFHDTRHTAATRVLRASKDLKSVQNMLGHASITSTARYAHALVDDVRNAMVAAQSRNSPELVKPKTTKALKKKG